MNDACPYLVAAMTSALLVGCLVPIGDELAAGSSRSAVAVHNDLHNNSAVANGVKVNGVKVNGVKVNGINLSGLTLNASVFEGVLDDQTVITGTEFVGTEFEASLEEGTAVALRIQAMTHDATLGLYFYTIEYEDAGDWYNVCDGDTDAIPVLGVWDETTGDYAADPTQFTFACRGAAIAKCVEWGYEPWNSRDECDRSGECRTQSLRPLHQACTRMVRADYCGDGVSWTQNGTLIDIWDMFPINARTPGSGMSLEAEWSTTGAACIRHTRWADDAHDNPARDYILAHCPSRWAGPDDRTRRTSGPVDRMRRTSGPGDRFCGGRYSDFHTGIGLDADPNHRRVLRNASVENFLTP